MAEDGTLEWAGELATWGRLRRVWVASAGEITTVDPDPAMCPIRFQGQWADTETGLSYNRFRYYDTAQSGYLAPDILGLAGGIQQFGYSRAPTVWIDPLGLYGVYVFRVLPGARRNVGQCYVGRGNPSRLQQSRKERSGFRDRRCANQHTRGRHYDTDAAAAAVGANPVEFGKLVEHVLIGGTGFNAVGRPTWANARLDGRTAWAGASQAERTAAAAEASRIQAFALTDSGCS